MFRDDPCLLSAPASVQRSCSTAPRSRVRPSSARSRPISTASNSATPKSPWCRTVRCRLGDPSGTFIGVPKEEVKKMLSDNFLSPDNVVLEQNSPIVNIGDKLVLFDTGMGTSKPFGPTTGRQQKSMAESGLKAEDIDARGAVRTPTSTTSAALSMNGRQAAVPKCADLHRQSDLDFWTDERKQDSPLKDFIVHARKNLLPVRDRIVFFKDNEEFLPGLTAHGGTGSYRRPSHVHDYVGRKVVRVPRRPHPSSGAAAGETADGIRLRHRSEHGGSSRA